MPMRYLDWNPSRGTRIVSPASLQAEVERLAGRGIHACARFYNNSVKQFISVPAPRRLAAAGARSKTPGVRHYVATTPATPGAPPRKLSGRLRASMAVDFDKAENVAYVGTNVFYGRVHEEGDHPFLIVVLVMILPQLAIVAGQNLQVTTNV